MKTSSTFIFAMALLGAQLAISGDAPAVPPNAPSALPGHIVVNDKLHISGQPTVAALAALGNSGYKTVIDLRPDSETPDLDEAAIVRSAGLKYYTLPLAGAQGLTPENVAAFDRLLATAKDDQVLVHCASGNRVGAMMALRARWIEGKSAEEALRIGKSSGLTGLTETVTALLQTNPAAGGSPSVAH